MGSDRGNLLVLVLSNPVLLLLYLPFLPLLLVAYALPASAMSNVEEWSIREDPETGEIKVTVHRKARRVVEVG